MRDDVNKNSNHTFLFQFSIDRNYYINSSQYVAKHAEKPKQEFLKNYLSLLVVPDLSSIVSVIYSIIHYFPNILYAY